MTKEHWIEKRLACNSSAVFDVLHAEVERVVDAWNNYPGNDPTVVRVARERDVDRFEKINVYLGDSQRAYFAHLPENSCITGSRTVWGDIGSPPKAESVAVTVRWDKDSDSCVMANGNRDETIESLARWALEPLLFLDATC